MNKRVKKTEQGSSGLTMISWFTKMISQDTVNIQMNRLYDSGSGIGSQVQLKGMTV